MNGKKGYVSSHEIAKKWGVSERSVRNYCIQGRIAGAIESGKVWLIPENATKPLRRARCDSMPRNIGGILREEMEAGLKGGIYHLLQVEFTYNSNHIEGSRLSKEQTRWIFETKTIGAIEPDMPLDDLIETANHFRCIDRVIGTYGAALTERYIKELHGLLKRGTSDSARAWFAVGEYKRLENSVGELETCPAREVKRRMSDLLKRYNAGKKTFEDIVEFHVEFERIHPFQDGNGRVGRLIMLKECLKHGITPFVIFERIRRFYYLGLQEWQEGRRERLLDTCRTGQDAFEEALAKLCRRK